MHPRTMYFLCCHVPGSILFCFYIAIIGFLLKRRSSYGSSFYTLFIFGGIILRYTAPDLVPFIADFVAPIQRVGNSTEWIKYSPYLSVFISSTYFVPYSQDCLNLVISLNRFTAIAIPSKHRKIWKSTHLKLYIFTVLLIAFVLSLNIIGALAYIREDNSDDEQKWYSFFADRGPLRIMSNGQLAMICILFFNSSAMFMYLLTAILMCRSNKSTGTERRLCLFGILLWVCCLPAICYQMYFALGGKNGDVITYGYSLIIMAKSLTPPLLLILTNQNLRADFWRSISGRQSEVKELSTVASSQ